MSKKFYSVVFLWGKKEFIAGNTHITTGVFNKCLWADSEADAFFIAYEESKKDRKGYGLEEKNIIDITDLASNAQ